MKERLTSKIVNERLLKNNFELMDEWKNIRTKNTIRCLKCNNTLNVLVAPYMYGKVKCKNCSKIEKLDVLRNSGYNIINETPDDKYRIKVKHNECGYIFDFYLGYYNSNDKGPINICPNCARNIKLDEELVSEWFKKNGYDKDFELLSLETVGYKTRTRTKMKVKCKKHDHIFIIDSKTFDRHKFKCKYCGIKKKSRNSTKISQEEFKYKIYEMYGNDIKILSEYRGVHYPILFSCTKCGEIRSILASNLLYREYKCRNCSSRKSRENKIKNNYDNIKITVELQNRNIEYYGKKKDSN